MIHEIEPSIFHNEYSQKSPKKDDFVFIFHERTLLMSLKSNNPESYEFSLPTFEKTKLSPEEKDIIYIFSIDNISYFLYIGDSNFSLDGFSFEDIIYMRRAYTKTLAFSCMCAWHLNKWYKENRYCGICRSPRAFGTTERSLICTGCGHTIYPKIMPAVIVGVTCKDKILMTRYAGRAFKGWALVAGFCEFGESAEDTVRREVMEEVGLNVKNIRYFSSQPWGIEQDLLLGYYCEVDDSTDISLDTNELSEAKWFSKNDIPPEKNLFSLTATMIENFRTN